MSGPLAGIRVVELASDHAAYAGKLLADMGAEVVLVEPPGGHRSRTYEPFVDDRPGPDRSLWWWHYHTSKLGVVLDLDTGADRELFRRLVATADVVLEGEAPGRLAALALDAPDLMASDPKLVWASVTAFGRDNPGRDEQFTDLTVLAGGGPVFTCGYDDHTLPPVRGGGNQGYHTGSVWAVVGILTAVLAREVTGAGQIVDVSMHAAANVTTEAGSYSWLVARRTLQRQTSRHASAEVTAPVLEMAADGRWAHTGLPPRTGKQFRILADWLDDLGYRSSFDDMVFLEMGAERDQLSPAMIGSDPEITEIFRAGREAMRLIASKLSAEEFFKEGQRRGMACGVIFSPEEALENEQFVARGFPVTVHHPDIDRDVVYPGAPFKMSASPWEIYHPTPKVGEHDAHVLAPLR